MKKERKSNLLLIYSIAFVCFVLIFLLASTKANCQNNNPCSHYSIVFTPYVGAAKSGLILGAEAGLWSVDRPLGFYGGLAIYDVTRFYSAADKQRMGVSSYNDMVLDPYVRASVKIYSNYETRIFQAMTIQGSLNGLLGVSWRGYKQIGYNAILGVETICANKTGFGANIVLTVVLD